MVVYIDTRTSVPSYTVTAGGAECDSDAGIMLQEFGMVRRRPQRVKEDHDTISSQIEKLGVDLAHHS